MVEFKARLDVPDLDISDAVPGSGVGPARAEVREALTGLGYAPDEVRDVLAQLPEEGTVERLLRDALKLLAAVHA
jgi:Holliday junction resolvasome RuvABC DNA-binding subunit